MGRRFFASVLAVALVASAAVIAFNAWVDPFQQYRKAGRFAPRFYGAWQRYENPGIARHYEYDRIVTGSSLMENVLPGDVDAIMGGRSINLSVSAQTAYDAGQLLRTALRTGKPRHVIMNLDYNAFSGPPDRSGFGEAFPVYLYDDTIWNDLPYLLGIGTLRKSLETVLGLRWSRFSTDPARMWAWMEGVEFSAAKVVRGLDADNINARFGQPQRTLEGMQASFEANLVPLVEAHPQVRFSFLYAPYSILAWLDFDQRGQLEVTLAFREWVLERTARYPNVEIFDFHAEPAMVLALDRFTDIYHHSPEVSRAVLRAMHEGRNKLTRQSVREHNEWLRQAARGTSAREVIAKARGPAG